VLRRDVKATAVHDTQPSGRYSTLKVLTGRAGPFPSEGEEAFRYSNGIQSFLLPSAPLLYNLFITEI